MRLVASVIVRNELDRYLPLAVTHLLSFCDEIRVLDDGSTDGTYEWLQERDSIGVKVLRNPGPSFFEHEGRARQRLFDWVLQARADYVLGIDADEFVGDPSVIREAVDGESMHPVFTIPLVEAWKVDPGGISVRVDGLWGPRKVPMLYMPPKGPPRRGSDRYWHIQDKQLACGREPVAVIRAAARAPLLKTEVFHFGWTRKSERQARAQRYFDHDGGKFHQDRHLQSILFPDEKIAMRGYPWPLGLRPMAETLIEHVG